MKNYIKSAVVLRFSTLVNAVIALSCAVVSAVVSANEVIIINEIQATSERHRYSQELLVAVLDSTIASHGEYVFETLSHLNQPRTAAMLRRREGYGDVVQGATRKDWEDTLIAIKIPIMKGILGLRVLLIREDMQSTFAEMTSLEQLKKQLGGVTSYWSITKIFEYHKFNIVRTNRQDSMFAMLARKRFDYISRGIHEVLIEYEQFKPQNPNLYIEENLLINIPLPVYFFVNPKKPELAKRIEVGLKNIIANGVLDKIFAKHFKGKFEQLNLLQRRVFELENPNLTSPYHVYKPEELKALFDKK